MSYSTCLNCGQKALSVATRCPHCGAPMGGRRVYEESPPRHRVALVLLTSVAALVVIIWGGNLLRLGSGPFRRAPDTTGSPPAEQPVGTPTDTGRHPEPVTAAAPVESPSTPAPRGVQQAESTRAARPVEEPAPTPVDSVAAAPPMTPPPRPLAPPRAPPQPAAAPEPLAPASGSDSIAPGQQRGYTNSWVNVRRARLAGAEIIKVLRPGEPVLLDSLKGGWYRVVIDSQTVGYIYRDFIASEPPAQ